MIRHKALSITLVFSLGLALPGVPTLQSQAYADDAAADSALTVQPGALGGNIVDLDGKTPVQGAKVQLLDKDGKVVAEATTDEKGVFQLGKQDQGDFTLKVGTAKGHLLVKDGAQASSLKFVLEQQVALGAPKAAATKIAAVSTTGAVAIAIGAAVVGIGAGIGIGYGIWGDQGKDKVFVPVGVSP